MLFEGSVKAPAGHLPVAPAEDKLSGQHACTSERPRVRIQYRLAQTPEPILDSSTFGTNAILTHGFLREGSVFAMFIFDTCERISEATRVLIVAYCKDHAHQHRHGYW